MAALIVHDQQFEFLNDYITALGATCQLHLYKSPIVIIPGLVVADMTAIECDFDGYNPVTIATFGGPFFYEAVDQWLATFDTIIRSTGSTTPNVVYGYYITTAAAADLIGVEAFDVPVNVAAFNDACPVHAAIAYPTSS